MGFGFGSAQGRRRRSASIFPDFGAALLRAPLIINGKPGGARRPAQGRKKMNKTLDTLKTSVLALALAAPTYSYAYWLNTDQKDCKIYSPKMVAALAHITWTGSCVNGKASGPGVLTAGGNKIEASVTDGHVNGHGKVWLENGQVYEGSLKEGLFEGQGNLRWKSGTHYTGSFAEGSLNGRGRKTYTNGEYYEGEFKNDKRNGRGTYRWTGGTTYTGEFKNNSLNGAGVMTTPDGRKLKTVYKNDKELSRAPL